MDDLVHGLKYEGWRQLAPTMGQAMAALELPWPGNAPAPPLVVPVPTSPRRLRARGYNQAELLARQVASALGMRMVAALERAGASPSQTSLAPEARWRNVRGAFRPGPGAAAAEGRSVILVDDVLTTGATASAAAECLADAGAGPVVVVTFARAVQQGARIAA